MFKSHTIPLCLMERILNKVYSRSEQFLIRDFTRDLLQGMVYSFTLGQLQGCAGDGRNNLEYHTI